MRWNFKKIDEAMMAAALDPSLWPRALECLSSQTGGRCSLLRPEARKPGEPAREKEPADQDGDYADRAWTGIGKIKTKTKNQAGTSAGRLSEVRAEVGHALWCLSVQREPQAPPFSAQEQKKLERVSRSLSRAAAIAHALDRASALAALEAFDVSNVAVILIRQTGHVVSTNKAANGLLRSGIKIVDGRLRLADPITTAAFEKALKRLLSANSDTVLLPPIRLPRRGKPPILAHPLRLVNVGTSAVSEPQAAFILIDPNSRKKSSESNLHIAFDLTPAEAKLASALATGVSLDQICERLEISKETGRNQLKSIFVKTGTRRQAELVLVIAKML